MSVRSLTTLAVERDTEAHDGKAFTDVLISAIPSEVLGLYTFVVTAIVGTITSDSDDKQLSLRWIVFGAGVLATVVYLIVGYLQARAATRKRRFPGQELTAAVVAFSAWGLVMPGSPLSASLTDDQARIWTAIITAAGVFVLFLLRGALTGRAKRAQG
jgi:FtsH-binding integral membrane protein